GFGRPLGVVATRPGFPRGHTRPRFPCHSPGQEGARGSAPRGGLRRMTAATAAVAAPPRGLAKIVATSVAASSIEWYDFFIYGTAAALVFPKAFFPADMPPALAQIASYSTFAVGFVARPVGGMIFGHFGDIVGRKKALVAALMLMGLGTT